MRDAYYHNYPYPEGYSLPVNFRGFSFEELRDFFGEFDSMIECYRALFSYEGDNWVVPYVCGKRTAYLNLIERGKSVDWSTVCRS